MNGKTILLIDDSPDLLVLARKILESEGFQVLEALTVIDAFHILKDRIPNLILTDLVMPKKDGFDFLRQRLSIPALKSIPVVVLSGLNRRDSVERAIALGACDYVIKPLRASLLLQKVRKALKSQAFRSYAFPESNRPKIQVSVAAEILNTSESGLSLQSSIKLGPESFVMVHAALLETLGCQGILTRTSKKPGQYLESGLYVSDIQFIGMNRFLAKKLRTGTGYAT